ncbi:MAG: hypothetical protein HZC47_05190 [Methanobacterium sp.]|uniref:hypothetical protein n=1 Tax=Methanobacterium sp. TaxID=2164 RepID=UPI003D64EFE7|nr:hypothetical protein [Methanobacterium sp.]
MTDRKWRIIDENKKKFYDAVAECEAQGYTLIPESFSSYPIASQYAHYTCLMKKE